MARHHRHLIVVTTALLLTTSLLASPGALADSTTKKPADQPTQPSSQKLPLHELRTFVEILNRVKQDYVEQVDDKKLLQKAIKGMVDGLDPHSAYLTPKAYRQLKVATSGEYGGLGIEVQQDNGLIRVVAPIDDTPAKHAGIQSGDLIIRIDGTAVKGMTLTDAVEQMRGKPGSTVRMTILRKGKAQPVHVQLKREVIHVTSVKSHMLAPGYGYIRISRFSSDTGDNLNRQLKSLQKKANDHLKGLVIDLRNNPGGVLSAAVAVSDSFLTKGKIVSIRGRTTDSDKIFTAKPGDLLHGRPIVVLVNQGTASAAEIVSGALQDHHRAIIMGQKTFGKGSVQTIMPLKGGAALKLTTARYYTPSGRSIQAEGIVPDVEVSPLHLTADKGAGSVLYSEANLKGALPNDAPNKPQPGARADKKHADNLAEHDYTLFEALNLLKGLHVLGGPPQQNNKKTSTAQANAA